jgi:hypothetical protein
MLRFISLAGAAVILGTPFCLAQVHAPKDPRQPSLFTLMGPHSGAAITSPNIGGEGTLDVLEGGGSSRVWSFDVLSNTWTLLGNAPAPVGPGGAISNLFNNCDFAFAGDGSASFFATGTACDSPAVLANAPAPLGAGAALTTAPGLVGSPSDLVFALRGAGSTDFWQYSISRNVWTAMAPTPAPAGDGAALIEVLQVFSCGSGSPSAHYQIAALRGGGTSDFWCFDINSNTWVTGAFSALPAAVGPGASLAQLQHLGRIYALRGGGTSDFWGLQSGKWVKLASTPGPVGDGGGLAGINYGTDSQRDELFALQGGDSNAVWKYDVSTDTWTQAGDIPDSRRKPVLK